MKRPIINDITVTTIAYFLGFINQNSESEITRLSMAEIICPKSEAQETSNYTSSLEASENSVDSFFTPQTTPLFLIILLPLICLKSPTFFTKFNSLGTINIFFLIGVVFYFATKWGINATVDDINSDQYIPMFKNSFPTLSGMMALGLFIHNAILTILKKNQRQENNVRILRFIS